MYGQTKHTAINLNTKERTIKSVKRKYDSASNNDTHFGICPLSVLEERSKEYSI
jgi:hypothetical protein